MIWRLHPSSQLDPALPAENNLNRLSCVDDKQKTIGNFSKSEAHPTVFNQHSDILRSSDVKHWLNIED